MRILALLPLLSFGPRESLAFGYGLYLPFCIPPSKLLIHKDYWHGTTAISQQIYLPTRESETDLPKRERKSDSPLSQQGLGATVRVFHDSKKQLDALTGFGSGVSGSFSNEQLKRRLNLTLNHTPVGYLVLHWNLELTYFSSDSSTNL